MYKSFNYIGSKLKLLDFITDCIKKYTNKQLNEIDSFADLFSGTGIVSFHLIQNNCKNIITNDIQHYSSIISSVWTKEHMDIIKLTKIINDINESNKDFKLIDSQTDQTDFIYHNYTSVGNRMYFTPLNGLKIDKTRKHIENLKNNNEINDKEYRLLLKLLLYAVVSISNCASVYGAFLKKSAEKPLILDITLLNKLSDNKDVTHSFFNKNVSDLLEINNMHNVELVYIDSPYNSRNYCDNYHLLQTISLYDSPKIKGKTGLRDENNSNAKLFCSKVNAAKEFEKILEKLKSKFITISYNSESIIPKEKMISLLKKNWNNVICYEKEYQRFKSNK